jgi:hypothetical protein
VEINVDPTSEPEQQMPRNAVTPGTVSLANDAVGASTRTAAVDRVKSTGCSGLGGHIFICNNNPSKIDFNQS